MTCFDTLSGNQTLDPDCDCQCLASEPWVDKPSCADVAAARSRPSEGRSVAREDFVSENGDVGLKTDVYVKRLSVSICKIVNMTPLNVSFSPQLTKKSVYVPFPPFRQVKHVIVRHV